MPHTINSIYFNEFDYIAIFVKGLGNTETAKSVAQLAMQSMEIYGCKRVFIDASETVSFSTTSENFNFAIDLPSILDCLDCYLAVYYKNDPHMYEMIYKLAQQNGINHLLLSDNREACMEWLLQQPIE